MHALFSLSYNMNSASMCYNLALFVIYFSWLSPILAIPQNIIWQPATATWYGDPHGIGSDGGACGYGELVNSTVYRSKAVAASPVIYNNGEGCGQCFKVKCLDSSICSKRAVTVVVTDECPEPGSDHHFDLGGIAYNRLAKRGMDSELRNRGKIPIEFRRTPCKYHGKSLGFQVNEGSTAFWLSLLVKYENGDGDIASMQIKEDGSSEWENMVHLWGATWTINPGRPLKAPFSLKLTTVSSHTLTAYNAIPPDWTPKQTYSAPANANFKLHY